MIAYSVHDNEEGGGGLLLASFGSGDRGSGGAPAALGTQNLFNRAQRLAEGSSGRGSAARRALAREVEAAASKRRTVGGKRVGGGNSVFLTDAERVKFTNRLRALSGGNRDINREQ